MQNGDCEHYDRLTASISEVTLHTQGVGGDPSFE